MYKSSKSKDCDWFKRRWKEEEDKLKAPKQYKPLNPKGNYIDVKI